MLVEEGKLTWDKPVRESVPAIQFYNDQLNNNVTLRDMLSHRTGVTRHDLIWFKSPFTRKELLDRKSTRLNSSHQIISYAVFCLKKKNKIQYSNNQSEN